MRVMRESTLCRATAGVFDGDRAGDNCVCPSAASLRERGETEKPERTDCIRDRARSSDNSRRHRSPSRRSPTRLPAQAPSRAADSGHWLRKREESACIVTRVRCVYVCACVCACVVPYLFSLQEFFVGEGNIAHWKSVEPEAAVASIGRKNDRSRIRRTCSGKRRSMGNDEGRSFSPERRVPTRAVPRFMRGS